MNKLTREKLAAELSTWWSLKASDEIDMVVDKAVEYGGNGSAIDLLDIGYALALAIGRQVDDEEATELGIYFYMVGKMARWKAAVTEGRRVSDDTLTDINIYCRMAQRTREVGGWPFGPKPATTVEVVKK
jgi:hypothetical protein